MLVARVVSADKVTFHRVTFRAILRRGGPGHVAREIVVVSVGVLVVSMG